MPLTLTALLVPSYTQMLGALAGWLHKAQAQMPPAEAEALLSARLAPDMFPLSTQIRFVCVQVREAMHRLRDEDFPATLGALLDEGRNAGDRPGTLAEALARIEETRALLDSLGPDALDKEPDSALAHALPDGMTFDMTAGQYARDWSLPQCYFHLMTAYAILRSKGVDLGKVDYVPHMFAYLRPGTAPGG